MNIFEVPDNDKALINVVLLGAPVACGATFTYYDFTTSIVMSQKYYNFNTSIVTSQQWLCRLFA